MAGLALHRRDDRCAHPQKKGAASNETRFYISSLPPDPAILLAASRSHWSIKNNLHWQFDVTFREDECRTKGHAALNLALMRHTALNLLKREPTKIPLKRKRLKAAINPEFRTKLLAVNDSRSRPRSWQAIACPAAVVLLSFQ